MTTPKNHLVVLEALHCPIPSFSIPHTYTEYYDTQPHEIAARIRDATIVIITTKQLTLADAEQAPNLRLLIIMATGCGWVQRDYFARRGVTVCNCPSSNIESCSGHALGLYFAVRRRTLQLHHLAVRTDEWAEKGTLTKTFDGGPPLSCGQEVVGIVGYGALGKGIEKVCRGVGMGEVVISERRGVAAAEVREGREAFEGLLKRASLIVICVPKDGSTEDLISENEIGLMRREAIVINMARGGIVNDRALAKALKERRIYGAATDVFDPEPARRGHSPLLPLDEEIPNLTVSPHVSWYAEQTLKNLQSLIKAAVEGFAAGKPVNVVVWPVSGAC